MFIAACSLCLSVNDCHAIQCGFCKSYAIPVFLEHFMAGEDFAVPFLVLSELVSLHVRYRSGGREMLEMDIDGSKKLIDILLQCGSGAFLSPHGMEPMPYATPFLKMMQCAIGEIGDSNAIKTSLATAFSGEMMVRLPTWQMNQTLVGWLTKFDRVLMDKVGFNSC
jgi:hypothetical protein